MRTKFFVPVLIGLICLSLYPFLKGYTKNVSTLISENDFVDPSKFKSWEDQFEYVYSKAKNLLPQSNVGILMVPDNGDPVGLPIHFEYKNGLFYFACDSQSKRVKNIDSNLKVCFLIYYSSMSQFDALIKGKAVFTDKSYSYLSPQGERKQLIYKIVPDEISFSALDPSSKKDEGIIRKLSTYVYTNDKWQVSQRDINIETALDDLAENMKEKPKDYLINK